MMKKIISMIILLIFIFPTLNFSQTEKTLSIEELYKKSHTEGNKVKLYKIPSTEQLYNFNKIFNEVVSTIFHGETDKTRKLAEKLHPLGFQIKEINQHSERLFVISEKIVKGGGFYILREKPKTNLVIMAPHTFFDVGTGDISLSIFNTTSSFILMTNTIHRYTSNSKINPNISKQNKSAIINKNQDSEELDTIECQSDLAHNESNFFFSAFKAVLQTIDKPIIIQLHGFNNKKTDRENLTFDLVISPGKQVLAKDLFTRNFAKVFKQELPIFTTALYSEDVNYLGAITNVHAKLINSQFPKAQFIHMEMSQKMRQQLLSDQYLLTAFITTLKKTLY